MSNIKMSVKNCTPDLDTICRLCLEPETGSINIFETSKLSIPVRIMACAALEVQSSDGLPKFICEKCRFQLEKSYYFRKKCQLSDGKLRKHIRLLNAGKRSRVFLKTADNDDDEDDEEQFEECLKFIRAEEEKLQKQEEEKRLKWLEEQQEQFRKEETQRLFEEFGNFMNSRKPVEKVAVLKKEKVDLEINTVTTPPKTPSAASVAPKVENASKRPREPVNPPKQREDTTEDEDDHEITSSDQPPEDQEQIWIYNDEEGDNTNEGVQTFFLYGKSDDEGNSQIIEIESERLDELDEELNRDDDADEVEECHLEIPSNDDENSEDFMLATEYEVCDNRDEDGTPLDSVNIVQSYQIEENGDIQYLKDETPAETLSISDEDEVQNMLTTAETSQYHEREEQKFVTPRPKPKLKRKATESAKNDQNEEQKSSNVPVIAVNYAKISTEDLKIFKCSECPQSFTRENSLLRHRSAHKKGREYSCDRCDKWFSCKSSLDRHMRIHTGEKPFTCEQCGKSYMQKEVLKRHLAIHSGERPHPCPHCPRAFVQKLLLTQHINATHLEVPRIQKHDCHLCPKSFHHASGLSRHLITHCGMKFRCSECGRSFNDKSSIRRHVLSVHSKAKDKTIIQAAKVATQSAPECKTDYII